MTMGWFGRVFRWLCPFFGYDTPNRKGSRFEEYVVTKFSRKYFRVLYWRGDKNINGVYAESDKNPDLEMEFRLGENRTQFAAECKWRKRWLNRYGEKNCISWAKDRQITNYNSYALGRNIPVFVIIGVGGSPDDPEDVYIVPLTRLKYPYATMDYLQQFRRRDIHRDFFFDADGLVLK
jgi:hypothetical protein